MIKMGLVTLGGGGGGGGGQATKPQRDGTIFMGEVDPLRHHVKIFNLAIVGGLGWMKWVKMGQGSLYFMQLVLHFIFFGEV